MTAQVDILQIFPTELQQIDWEASKLNVELESELWKKRALDPEGVYRSNAGGTWHSKDDVLSTTGKAGEKLADLFHSAFTQYAGRFATYKGELTIKLSAWAMMYSDRGYATVHTHPNCHFSSVYYVDAGAPAEDIVMATGVRIKPGTIEFVDTRAVGSVKSPGMNFQPGARIEPKNGRMLVFPNWLPHCVHPVVGDHTRIAISCNCTILNYVETKET
jgi:uncharacterized protein (TIGR02466 family)